MTLFARSQTPPTKSSKSDTSFHGRYLQLRGTIYWFRLRVPSDLVERYGKTRFLRVSLKTSDLGLATREAEARSKYYFDQFDSLRNNLSLAPKAPLASGLALTGEKKAARAPRSTSA